MAETYRIIIVEDSPADANLAKYEIAAVLPGCEFAVVRDCPEYLATLQSFQPHLIISDYTLPRFDGMAALQLAQQHSPFTPVILWTGTITEDIAVQCMKAGASNYVLKDNLKRLGPAVRHALEERTILIERAQAEEALRCSEERFRTLYERMPLGYQSLDANGCFVDVNQAWLDALGYQRDEVIGHWFGDFLIPEHKALFLQRFPRFKEIGEVHNIEFIMLRKDGSHTYVSFDGRIGYDQHMQFKQTHCILADITERKRAEEALRASEAKYRTLVESLPDIIMRFDRHYRHLYVSPSVQKVVNLAPEEFIGKTHRQLGFDPDQAAYWEKMIQSAFDAGTPLRREFTFDGDSRKTIFEWDLIPERDEQGQVHSILSISRDITARKQADEAQRAAASVMQSIPSGLFIYAYQEPDRLYLVNANPAALHQTNLVLGKVVGKEFNEIWPNAMQTGITAAYLNVMHTGEPYFGEDIIYADEHLQGAYKIIAFAMPDNHLGVAFEDVTARYRVEAQIRQALAEKEALLKEVHHRVKNNLASIIALIGLQKDDLQDPAAIAEMGELINRVHSMALVHELLYQSETLNQVDLQDYFTRLTTHVRASYEAYTAVELHIAALDVTMTLENAIPCGLIVNELVTNAFKYAFPEGQPRPGQQRCEITVTASQQDDMYTITVQDNGIGLPVDFNLAASPSLGLQLVTMLAQRQLDGQLELDRTRGTTFRLRFAAL